MADKKYVQDPIQFLVDTGLLFEMNRQVLHPFGVELNVLGGSSDGSTSGMIMIKDKRDKEEGFIYELDGFLIGIKKFNDYLEESGLDRIKKRQEILGYATQDYPDPYIKKNGVLLMTYNPDYDSEDKDSPDALAFRVPYDWLNNAAAEWYGYTISEFLNEYTYDHAEPLYAEAKEEGVIIEEIPRKRTEKNDNT